MAETRIAPFTLTDFASIPEHTIFVQAYEYSLEQFGFPLDFTLAYRKLASTGHGNEWFHRMNPGCLYSFAEMVKYDGYGLCLNGLSSARCEPGEAVITGPSITLLPKFGGPLDPPVLEVLQMIYAQPRASFPRILLLPNQNFGLIETITASRTLASWLNILAQRQLISLDATNIELKKLGILRVIQESETNGK